MASKNVWTMDIEDLTTNLNIAKEVLLEKLFNNNLLHGIATKSAFENFVARFQLIVVPENFFGKIWSKLQNNQGKTLPQIVCVEDSNYVCQKPEKENTINTGSSVPIIPTR